MLPGFRFLFAAIMLSMSLLVFGLGAAALLRAAHESFASNPSWRGAPEVALAQRPETTLPVLTTLRVDTNAMDKPAMEKAADQAKAGATPADQPSPPESAAGEPVAASRPVETLANEATKPDSAPVNLPVAENPPAPEAVPATGETVTTETKMAAIAALDTPPANSEPAIAPSTTNPAAVNPTTADPIVRAPTVAAPAMAAEADSTAAKIATLGGPPVDIADTAAETTTAKADRAKADPSVIKRRVHARRSIRRRRLAALARLAALQQQQLQANPFAQQPLTTVASPRQYNPIRQ